MSRTHHGCACVGRSLGTKDSELKGGWESLGVRRVGVGGWRVKGWWAWGWPWGDAGWRVRQGQAGGGQWCSGHSLCSAAASTHPQCYHGRSCSRGGGGGCQARAYTDACTGVSIAAAAFVIAEQGAGVGKVDGPAGGGTGTHGVAQRCSTKARRLQHSSARACGVASQCSRAHCACWGADAPRFNVHGPLMRGLFFIGFHKCMDL